MTDERYKAVMQDGAGLTVEECAQGWHFCGEFDGLLVGPGMGEQEYCTCDLPAKPPGEVPWPKGWSEREKK